MKLTKAKKGVRVSTMMIYYVNLNLPSRGYLSLKECHYVTYIDKNIISAYCLNKMGYALIIEEN